MKMIDHICIIDDDAITVFGIKKLLTSTIECNNIDAFSNGKLAIEYLSEIVANKTKLPDLIFLDLNMPIMDGWEFLEEFLKLPIADAITVNIVTSSINKEDRDKSNFYKCRTHHNITYNTKPLNKVEIEKITDIA
ncbi:MULTISPECIES: response regulator [Cellulophaga]|uniref:Response regulator receiver domain-containing protein n=2 Tax=Cellulophaga baltica TaxID=76594 RepID=A0A1G7KMD9_9FLAO|nr:MULTISPECIES: response regulator [Cellulophaga]AIY13342.1 response regulator [Cellulophaga baltica NN016038]AIZ41700.1 response regulator [Cellulophaga baltica 18]KGK29521.1 response regulator [Cellulophaga sp. E6(2014)]MBA6316746.1 response regulator [Cellulophaga baltica]SDF38392.1 Response regulator receiver domain-containing protein [Cellulophaga baltica]